MKAKRLFVLLCLLQFSWGQAQQITCLDGTTTTAAELDEKVRQLVKDAGIHGLGLSILNHNEAVFVRTYGYRNMPRGATLDTATIMYGASLSKAVYGYLVVKLAEQKVIDLDKPLYQYLQKPLYAYDYFSDLKSDDRWKLITAKMCLSHTTGLPNLRWFNPITGEEDTLGVMKIYFDPGSRYAYSGEGFKLLQLVIEEITGRTTESLAMEHVFVPMGMHRTGYIWHENFGDENVAVGHMNNGAIDIKRKRSEAVAGGSMVTTQADYTRFAVAMLQRKGISTASFEAMVRPQVRIHSVTQFPPITFTTTTANDQIALSYGLGWGLLQCPYGRAMFKEGNGGAWRNYHINFIDKGIGVVILVNSEGGEGVFQAILQGLMGDQCIPWKWEGYIPFNQKQP